MTSKCCGCHGPQLKDPNDIVQKTGCTGQAHGQVFNPCGIVYVTKAQVEHTKSVINGGNALKEKKNIRKVDNEKMTQELACIIVAECFTSELNIQFDNPDNNPLANVRLALYFLLLPLFPQQLVTAVDLGVSLNLLYLYSLILESNQPSFPWSID